MSATAAIQGGKELDAKLKALPPKVEKQLARKGLRAAAKIIQQAERAKAPKYKRTGKYRRAFGQMAKAIKVRAVKKRKAGSIRLRVGIPAGNSPTFYSAFVVLGRRIGKRTAEFKRAKKAGFSPLDTRPSVPPNPFPRRAFDRVKDQALVALTDTLRAGLETLAK